MALTLHSFIKNDLEEAAALTACRYQAARAQNQLLPAQFEQAEAVAPHLEGLVGKVPGVVARRDNRMVGFLIGFRANLFHGQPGVFVPDWAHAAVGARIFDTYRAMYAELAPQWLADGGLTHAMQGYASDQEFRAALVATGFGQVVIDALRDLTPVPVSQSPAVEIRQAGPEASATLAHLEAALDRHLATAPIWLAPPDHASHNWVDWLTDRHHAAWLAYHHDEATAFLCIEPSSRDGLPLTDEVTASITGAYTLPTLRGHGIGAALLNQALAWARVNGYQKCAVDFESANLSGAHFWLSHFQPVCYSFARRVDERLA